MNSLPEGLGTFTELSSLKALRAQAEGGNREALQAAASQFESVFIHMLLKSMRAATPDSPLFAGPGAGLYRDLFDMQLSQALGVNQGLGIAQLLVSQLAGDRSAEGAASIDAQGDGIEVPPRPPADVRSLPRAMEFSSPEEFVSVLHPHARRAASSLGLPAEVLLAQAALETGWGQLVIRHDDGRSSHNLFGIKANAGWAGERVGTTSLEFADGALHRTRAEFRSYDGVADSFEDYVDFVTSNPRYRAALRQTSQPASYLRELQSAGYATDPRYAEKILEIMGRPPFGNLKAVNRQPL